ncbi:hypothetical protein ACWCQ0_41370 [Streptomyces massasporeus]|uniref:Uncharacterized protein n=1 Tax=Streptomyces massasporeus TaxID=67324 RepID=A0ABW6LQ96_9ACTN
MPDADPLRASRDGDQFHYHWAARQALKLLLPDADLTAIAVEGVSHDDTQGCDGEDVIDIAEYYGAAGLREANRVVYRQLKHSTTQATEEWTVSGLAGTVGGFAEKSRRIRQESPGLEQKVTFELLSNRPVRDSVLPAIGILAAGGESGAYAHAVKFLKKYACLVDHCKDANHHLSAEMDRLCEALAALRRIPIGVLTELCGVPSALVRSFAADLGRPLLADGDTLQFRDEPTETWFRTRYRPTGNSLINFIDRLTPLAAEEPYVAASLPQLLWEAGQVDTLVELAMTDGALPESDDLEQREIAQQRAQFALKATLRVGQEGEAARQFEEVSISMERPMNSSCNLVGSD